MTNINRTIGIMGGTFDPIHNGHLALAEAAQKQLNLEQVLFMPSGNPPHKPNQVIASGAQRKAMIELAIAGHPGFCYSGMELERDGYGYTADTMQILREENPDTTYYFIIGADSLFAMESWYQPKRLFSLTRIAVACRDAYDDRALQTQIAALTEKYQAQIVLLPMAPVPGSSHEIRELFRTKGDVSAFVPESVSAYIRKEGLYC